MSRILLVRIAVLATVALLPAFASAQIPAPTTTPEQVGTALGFTNQEIQQIKAGQVISKTLNEGSDRELAGAVAVLIRKPIGELVDVVMRGKMLESDRDIVAFRVWRPEDSRDDPFADVGLSPSETSEAKNFARALPGDKLNLSAAEIAQFSKFRPTPNAVNIPLRAALRTRYEAYLQKGLSGIPAYSRGRNSSSSPASDLVLAIRETMPVTPRKDFFEGLLSYPANQPANVEHRFSWFKQTVEDRPTFILAHAAQRHTDTAAVMTEEQFYVSHSYNSNFIAAGCLSVEGGTLVFYVNRTFTDQVAGFASGTKHNIGRGQMLSEVTEKLKRFRDELQK